MYDSRYDSRRRLRECNYGAKCNRRHDPSHTAVYSHPPASLGGGTFGRTRNTSWQPNPQSYGYSEWVTFPSIGQVVGVGGWHLSSIKKTTGAQLYIVRGGIEVKANSLEQLHTALDILQRLSAMGSDMKRVQQVFTNYRPDDTARFIRTPASYVISFGAVNKKPHMLSTEETNKESGNEVPFSQKTYDMFLSSLQPLEEFVGRIKFEARFGKRVYYDLSDELRYHPFKANMLIEHMKHDKSYRSVFCTGASVNPDFHDMLGEHTKKERYDFKTIAKFEGKYYPLNVTNYVDKEGNLVCDGVYSNERKHLLVDYTSLDQNILDLRLALQTSSWFEKDHFLYPLAQQLIDTIHLDTKNGAKLTFQSPPNMFVYAIRHKKLFSYNYEDRYNISITNVEMQEMQEELLQAKEPTLGVTTVQFTQHKTEVEVAPLAWRKAFKFNKYLVRPGENNPMPWNASVLLEHLEGLVQVSKSVSELIFPTI
jgi:hypothetical protein